MTSCIFFAIRVLAPEILGRARLSQRAAAEQLRPARWDRRAPPLNARWEIDPYV